MTKLWRAAIKVKGRAISLGTFKTEDEAALAYNQAARLHFGDMAYQNAVGGRKKRRLGESS